MCKPVILKAWRKSDNNNLNPLNIQIQKSNLQSFCLHLHRNIMRLFLLLVLWTIQLNAQPAVPKPTFNTFQPIGVGNKKMNNAKYNDPIQETNMPMGLTSAEVIRQSQQNTANVMGVTSTGQPYHQSNTRSIQLAELEELKKNEIKENYNNNLQRFEQFNQQLLQLNPNNFSITKAVYLSEAPFYNYPPSFEVFQGAIKQKAKLARQILQKEGLSEKNNSAINYAIQKLFSQNNIYYDTKTKKEFVAKKIAYDFDDFDGEKDWTKMFVTKLLQTNSGQCHSLPLLYLCIAEQLHAKAYLSLAPNHSFIQYFDSKGERKNFETTNGNLVNIIWLMQSNAISSIALKNKTYLIRFLPNNYMHNVWPIF